MTKQQKIIFVLLILTIAMNTATGIFGAITDKAGFEGWFGAALGNLLAFLFYARMLDTQRENARLREDCHTNWKKWMEETNWCKVYDGFGSKVDKEIKATIKPLHEEEDGTE